MFIQALTTLLSSGTVPENVPVPRAYDGVAEECNTAALHAMRTEFSLYLPSDRVNAPEKVIRAKTLLRDSLESLIWVSGAQSVIERTADLIGLICSEYSWSDSVMLADDPAHPSIDTAAAETGMLLSWIMRKHGAKLDELDPKICALAREQLRRRLIVPITSHDDYPFFTCEGQPSALVLCDLLLTVLFTERTYQRRSQAVKKLLRALDRNETLKGATSIPVSKRLTDACALADTVRIIKRMTRGEIDLTASVPEMIRLDDILTPYLGDGYFLDPAGPGIESSLSGIDLFRLGYLAGDPALRAIGSTQMRECNIRSRSVTGRVLSMEYLQAASEESTRPPCLKRAVMSDGMLMLVRSDGLTAAACAYGNRSNAGNVTLFADGIPILCDPGSNVHSLPIVGAFDPCTEPKTPPCEDNFSASRDLITLDLTDSYPPESGITAYQRTLMLSRASRNLRLVDAFDFTAPPQSITFRFTCGYRCMAFNDRVRIGPVLLTWDGKMEPAVTEQDGIYYISLTMVKPPKRVICGFSFDAEEAAPESAAP